MNFLARLFLRRTQFKGQFRLFMWLFSKKLIKPVKTIGKPITGNFKIALNTANFVDASIYITGDYEPYLKKNFIKLIKPGNIVLDVGANIGFHTLFFSELVGHGGQVYAFEPIQVNFESLSKNITINNYKNIKPQQLALGSKNEIINVHISYESNNPGAFSLLEKGEPNTEINCRTGDSFIKDAQIYQVDFIKIDVEGYEIEVLKGLQQTIMNFRPHIIFEFDKNYQSRINEDPKTVFYYLQDLNYTFHEIDGYGQRKNLSNIFNIENAEILAIPN